MEMISTIFPLHRRWVSLGLALVAGASVVKVVKERYAHRMVQTKTQQSDFGEEFIRKYVVLDTDQVYRLKQTMEQDTLKQALTTLQEQSSLGPMALSYLRICIAALGRWRIMEEMEEISLEKVAKLALADYQIWFDHPKHTLKLPSGQGQWALTQPHGGANGLRVIVEGTGGSFSYEKVQEHIKSLVEYADTFPNKQDSFEFTPPTLKELDTLELQLQTERLKELPSYAEAVLESGKHLHLLWKLLAYPQPIILKGSDLLNSLCHSLIEKELAPQKGSSYSWAIWGALASGLGAIALFLYG